MKLLVTTSWDDGFPSDRRVADLLAQHGLKGTFYVPTANAEGRPVLDVAAIRDLGQAFEVGGHGRDHRVLTGFSGAALHRQISENREMLTQALGHTPQGFCYVRGKVNAAVERAVRACGYGYARTTRNFQTDLGVDPFRMPTTIQFYPHDRSVYARNLVRGGGWTSPRLWAPALGRGTFAARMIGVFEAALATGGCFHLWGHSWELDALGLWDDLTTVLREIASAKGDIQVVDNAAAAAVLKAAMVRPVRGLGRV